MCDDPAACRSGPGQTGRTSTRASGVLVLTDVYGATPCNTVCKVIASNRVEAIAGVNLPMLLKALTYRDQGMVKLLEPKPFPAARPASSTFHSEPGLP
jgi:mannose PTS system EIIA component